jgi:ribosome biogenesis protein MAK21
MKKNKSKSAGTSKDTPAGVEIAPEALANLADRLKLDLASQGQLKSKNAPVSNWKGKGKKENEKQSNDKESKTSKMANGNNVGMPKKPVAVKEKEQKLAEKKSKSSTASEKKSVAPPTSNGDGRPPKDTKVKKAKTDSKANGRPPKESASSKAETNTKSPSTKKDKKRFKANASAHQEDTPNPLLDEILALGGTKEDLDLIEDVDSEEDADEESDPPKKSKGGEKTVQPF